MSTSRAAVLPLPFHWANKSTSATVPPLLVGFCITEYEVMTGFWKLGLVQAQIKFTAAAAAREDVRAAEHHRSDMRVGLGNIDGDNAVAQNHGVAGVRDGDGRAEADAGDVGDNEADDARSVGV